MGPPRSYLGIALPYKTVLFSFSVELIEEFHLVSWTKVASLLSSPASLAGPFFGIISSARVYTCLSRRIS